MEWSKGFGVGHGGPTAGSQRDPEQAHKEGKAGLITGPMAPQLVGSNAPPRPAQYDRRDRQVVNRTQHRDKVRDQVDRAHEIDEESTEGDLHATWRCVIAEQGPSEADEVGDETQGRPGDRPRRPMEPHDGNEDEPGECRNDEYGRQHEERCHARMVGRGCPSLECVWVPGCGRCGLLLGLGPVCLDSGTELV
jgi:hypothetical protein